MKKILGISLVAMMAVTTANAQIASKAYVDVTGTHPIVSASNTTGANIGALADAIGTGFSSESTVADQIAAAVSGSSDAIDALNLTAVTGVIKSVSQTKGQVAAEAGTIVDADVAGNANIAQSKIANLTTDLASKAAASDLTAETTARTNADTAINTLIGTIPAGATATTVTGYVDEKVAEVAGDVANLGALATKSEVAEADLATALATKINGKADASTTLAGYGITDAYTKTAADGKFQTLDNLATSTSWTTDKSSDTKYASAKAVDAAVSAVSTVADGLDDRLDVLEGSGEGSVAKAEQDAKDYADGKFQVKSTGPSIGGTDGAWTALTNDQLAAMNSGATSTNIGKIATNESAIATLNGDNTTNGSVAKTVKDAIDALDTSVDADLALKQDKLGSTNVVNGSGTGNVVTSVTASDGTVTVNKTITAIPQPTATNETGTLVLTATSDGNGGYTYQWEGIARAN